MICDSTRLQSSKILRPILFALLLALALPGCGQGPDAVNFDGLKIVDRMDLEYAQQFIVDHLANGCSLISISESGCFLLVPEGKEPPANISSDVTILRQPLKNIYLAATSAMCLFDALNSLDHISMSGTKADGWYIEKARVAMEEGDIVYAGKYSAPDYELLISKGCDLAIESTMILHTPEVKEKLEDLGIPVLVERSSYEPHPLGRTEWIKLYGLLCGEEERAQTLFDEQVTYLHRIPSESTGKSVAFFYISSAGNAVVRKGGDYTSKMIELAGGRYVFADSGDSDNGAGPMNLDLEHFYTRAKKADIIIYNSAIDGEVHSLAELLAKSHLLADFEAVKSGNVWCTNKNLFQETTEFGSMIADLNRIFTGKTNNKTKLNYYYKLQ
ncbi:MAG: ABC transporter substrate-binding protein [Firmicutes bacterium]|nr:ABC transporter substrate-binding protein [Bacillota bacterium]